jgi:hypothetical protein
MKTLCSDNMSSILAERWHWHRKTGPQVPWNPFEAASEASNIRILIKLRVNFWTYVIAICPLFYAFKRKRTMGTFLLVARRMKWSLELSVRKLTVEKRCKSALVHLARHRSSCARIVPKMRVICLAPKATSKMSEVTKREPSIPSASAM